MSEPFIVRSLDDLPAELGRPEDPAALRDAWAASEERWSAAYERVAGMPAGAVDARVDEEWSFTQTLRHLVFAADSWVGAVRGEADYHPWGLPFTELKWDLDSLGLDTAAAPSYAEVLEVRAGRVGQVRDLIAHTSAERLAELVDGPVWEPGPKFAVLACLQILLNEEWHHLRYATRDLDRL